MKVFNKYVKFYVSCPSRFREIGKNQGLLFDTRYMAGFRGRGPGPWPATS